MSSLAASRADGYYHPPDYNPAKHKSLNAYRNSHGALGKRASKLSEGILVIRFEMPYDSFCTSCQAHIAKGMRFNAEKKQVGSYHSTKIWSFGMRTPCCQTRLEIRTDPENCDYVIVSGARRKVEEYNAADAQVHALLQEEERDKIRSDPLYRLEHSERAKHVKRIDDERTLDMLQDAERHRADYDLNRSLRKEMRVARKEEQGREARRRQLGLPEHVSLLPDHEEDEAEAKAQVFARPVRRVVERKKEVILQGPILKRPREDKTSREALLRQKAARLAASGVRLGLS